MQLADDPETVRQLLHINRLIRQYVGKNMVLPLWYRGLSHIQLCAAKAISQALVDDKLQESTHRVYEQLHRLGVYPLPPRSDLVRLMHMSRGNDVAFLWFLMEMFYKSDNHEHIYELNEQIIMTVIFWLDLYPTLYQLDLVLPLPHASEEARRKKAQAIARREKLVQRQRRQKAKFLKQKAMKTTESELPYFQKPINIKFRRSKLLADYPMISPPLPNLVRAPDPKKSVLLTRWFGYSDLSDGQRIVRTMLHKEITNIFDSLEAAKLETDQVETMCRHHNQIAKMEESLRRNLERIKREHVDQLLDVNYQSKEMSRRRTLAELERLVKVYKERFHQLAVKTRLTSIGKRLCADMYDPGFVYIDSNDSLLSDAIASETRQLRGCESLKRSPSLLPSCIHSTPKPKPSRLFYAADAPLPQEYCEELPRTSRPRPEKEPNPESWRPSQLMRFILVGGNENVKEDTAKPSQSQCSCRRESNKFFKLNSGPHDYRFNYRKLFESTNDKKIDNERLRLKKQFIKALDDDMQYLSAATSRERDSLRTHAGRTANRMFQHGTELFQEEYERMQMEVESDPRIRLNFGQDYYDANDSALMKEMLRRGLERVGQDHRYVLPSLPNVESVPLLLSWISTRYGKRYSKSELERSFRQDSILTDHLTRLLRHNIMLSQWRSHVGPIGFSRSLQMQNVLDSITKERKEGHRRRFILSILELGRRFHAALRDHLSHSTVSTYYAYMPAHPQDVEFNVTAPFANRRKPKTKLKPI